MISKEEEQKRSLLFPTRMLGRERDISTQTEIFQFEGFLFFMRETKKGSGGNLIVDVVMKGSQKECEGFMIEASMLDANSDEDKMAFKSTFPPKPLEKENKEGFCLSDRGSACWSVEV